MRQEQDRRSARWSVTGTLLLSVLFSGATLADSPVADAAMNGDIEAVRALLQDGADVNAAQGDGMTALHWAAEAGDVEMVGILLYAGAHVRGLTRLGDYTPLHLASKAGADQVVVRLLEAGADPSAYTTTGEVPVRAKRRQEQSQHPEATQHGIHHVDADEELIHELLHGQHLVQRDVRGDSA